jgi:hypothetical protein
VRLVGEGGATIAMAWCEVGDRRECHGESIANGG